jgi:hypothetical protein
LTKCQAHDIIKSEKGKRGIQHGKSNIQKGSKNKVRWTVRTGWRQMGRACKNKETGKPQNKTGWEEGLHLLTFKKRANCPF